MGTPEKNSSSILPKMRKQLNYRTLAFVIVVGGLACGLVWFLKVRQDLGGLRTSNTVGWIAAVQYSPQGQQVVLISPDGKVHKDPGHKPNTTDRDVTWSPHGNFLYFVSDRAGQTFNLFRWSPGSEDVPEQRTIGTRSRSSLRFPVQPSEDGDSIAKGLITTGGLVQEFDPSNQSTAQVLPPTSKEITQSGGDENGTEGQFEGYYGSLGTSFREAQWCGNKHYIAAIMRRESGEILIVQEMTPVLGKFPAPRPIVAGEHVDFAVVPKTGNLVYCVQGFQWPGAPPPDKEGKPMKRPWANGIGAFELGGSGGTVLGANQGEIVFTQPSVNPDGTQMVVVMSKSVKGEISPIGLVTLPTTRDPSFKGKRFDGDIHEPTWSADGTKILAAVRRPGLHRTIFEIPMDGSPVRNVTGDSGDFGFPQYSPQQKGD